MDAEEKRSSKSGRNHSETESFSDFDCGNFSADNGRTFIK